VNNRRVPIVPPVTLQRSVPILMYHEVARRAPAGFEKFVVSPVAFARQMRWLAWRGYTAIGLDLLLDAREGRAALPVRPVVVTFDDGFQECVDHAAPVLKAYGFRAIFYLVTGFMGATSRWLRPILGFELPIMSWSSARALLDAGFDCGAHTVSHPHLTLLSTDACRGELAASRAELEAELGRAVRHLAYPFGSYDAAVRACAEEAGYRSACSVRIGLSAVGDDRLALHRVPVSGTDSFTDFVWRLRTAHTVAESVRSGWRRLRGKTPTGDG
jgi:peptidoglycan/xylan/chitin deacetylase (PgdA/CDA1 family)